MRVGLTARFLLFQSREVDLALSRLALERRRLEEIRAEAEMRARLEDMRKEKEGKTSVQADARLRRLEGLATQIGPGNLGWDMAVRMGFVPGGKKKWKHFILK